MSHALLAIITALSTHITGHSWRKHTDCQCFLGPKDSLPQDDTEDTIYIWSSSSLSASSKFWSPITPSSPCCGFPPTKLKCPLSLSWQLIFFPFAIIFLMLGCPWLQAAMQQTQLTERLIICYLKSLSAPRVLSHHFALVCASCRQSSRATMAQPHKDHAQPKVSRPDARLGTDHECLPLHSHNSRHSSMDNKSWQCLLSLL